VQFKNWTLTVGDRAIEIPHEKTVLVVANDGKKVRITANGKTVYED